MLLVVYLIQLRYPFPIIISFSINKISQVFFTSFFILYLCLPLWYTFLYPSYKIHLMHFLEWFFLLHKCYSNIHHHSSDYQVILLVDNYTPSKRCPTRVKPWIYFWWETIGKYQRYFMSWIMKSLLMGRVPVWIPIGSATWFLYGK